ncbi:MAG: hypothetical protein AAGG47_01525 [Pseudomonadota bacterium]
MNETTTKPDLSDLSATLMEDPDGKARDAIIAMAQEKARMVKSQLDAGVSPAEYKVLVAMHAALEAIPDTISMVWSVYQLEDEQS